MNTIKINACPKCGAPVPPEAPLGLCPRCVMAAVAAPEVAPTATSQIPSLERLAVAFPQLQILELIGRGGMGFVFKARQPHLDRFVALKLLPDSLAHDPQFAERFNREGRVLARLNHPNIVSIFDFGQAGGFYYLMMEYVDGVNLRQAMQAGRFSPAEALTIVPKICEALQFAHEEGILHRDIKPENILLDSKGRIKIADFGIAKLVGEDKPDISLTATGAALGTMHYMAPEQIEKPATVDHRADIYSLGVVFYELLTGELPLGRFGPPSARTPVDPRVDDVVMRTLEREREKRFQSAGEMKTNVEHLTEVGAGAAVQALTPAEDFILCPPRLPRMAKAIIVYALVLAPLFWLLGLFTIEPLPDHALVKFVQGALNVLISGVEFLVLIVLAIGGWKLRGLRPSAPTWLKTGLWLHFSLMLLAIAGQIYVERLASELIRNAPLKRPVLADGIMLAAGLACIVFEISAFVWLRRHTALLKSLCPPAAKSSRPRGTMVIKPGDVVPSVPQWSLKAVWGAVLVGISLLPMIAVVLLVVYLATSRHGGAIGGWEMILILIAILPGITGTILGWMGLSDVRAHAGQRRGLPLAVFAALALPLGLLLLTTFVAPLWFYFVYMPAQNGGALPIISATLMLLVPAGTLTFAIWAVYATARWSANQPAPERRGKLKWIFAGLMACGVGYIALASLQHVQRNRAYDKANEDRLPNPPMAAVDTNTIPWIRFTFTSVELREEKGVRWLAIDYLDDVHGECQKSFPWENTIPGFTATTRATEFLKESKDFSPEVRHQRIEYRMPDSSPRDQLERLRDNLNKALKQKSFRLELGENEVPLLLFELPGVEGGSLQARFKVVPPLRVSPEQPLAFGPVLERFLPEFTAIDLHSGQTKTLPLSLTNRNITAVPAERDIEIFDWLEREGMDFAFLGGHIFQGRMPGMGTLSFEAWDFSPTQLDASVRTIGKVVPFKVEDNPRGNFTYGFKTRGGKLGLLKIIYADNPRGVKFRYKLVQSGKDDADEARIRLAREVMAAAQKNFDAGRLNPFEMAQAEREFAAAESRGDAVAAARLNLKFAEASLRETKRRVEIGVLAPLDLKFAESRHAQAEIDLKAALTANSATAKTVQAEVTPPNENGANARALQFRLVADDADTTTPTDMMMESRGNGTSNSLRVLRTVLLDGSVVDRAAIGLEANGHSTIEVELTTEGARQFAAITAANVNRRLAIVSGGRVLSAPIIRTAISGGKLQISGSIPPAEARQIVATLNRTELVDVSNPTSDARMVIDVFKIEDFPPDAPPPTNRLDWSFKCLIPPEHTAQILFVRWTNDVPNIIEGHSAYYKVGNTPAEVDVLIDHDLNGPPVPPEKRSQWSSNLGLGFTLSTYDAVDPPYRKLSTPSRMSVRSGHQQKIPLVEFNDAGGHANRIELMVFLQPLSTRAIRTVPTEKDQGHFISGKGLAGTRQEALQAIRDLPTDP